MFLSYSVLFNCVTTNVVDLQDIAILSQTFERVVDRKNSVIKALAADADEADEQYNKALRSHLFNIDRLVGETSGRGQRHN